MSKELTDRIYEVLEEVMDPELGIDIVNLGLIYDVLLDEENNVQVNMTMTSMGCPMAPQIMSDAHMKLSANIKELREIKINIVWSPAWTKDRMSRYARIALGIPS
ncbi:Metal-sulfur cluster biosynthetic enzyme [Mesobacillus persicus]|uniref:Metal-sulfur cluster biosynthetic enzyme n=1 Tax=Mesobacillus persicus TaxID=930146 RepID=A0A1H8CRE3_9BACI|nr:metal-sulfur cluster assembly factor [Mesobacillus persicus]SEM97556.1 Metal-sulfur cluster biosynthetic enzyme [Mesobacillus persicus]